MINKVSFALIALGLLLGPAYWIYSKFYTGSQVALLKLAPGSATEDGGPTWQSEPFRLDEAMGPVGLILQAQGHFSPNMDENKPPKDAYSAALSRDGEAAQPLNFTLGVKHVSDSNPAFREHLLLMQQVKAGEYRLQVQATGTPSIQMDSLALEVRQHLHEPDPRVVTGGVVLFILGILGLVMG